MSGGVDCCGGRNKVGVEEAGGMNVSSLAEEVGRIEAEHDAEDAAEAAASAQELRAMLGSNKIQPSHHPSDVFSAEALASAAPDVREALRGAMAGMKTGDVILYSSGKSKSTKFNMIYTAIRTLSRSGFTHTGIVLRIPVPDGEAGAGASSRLFVVESLGSSKMPLDVVEGGDAARLQGSIRIFPLEARVLGYNGSASLLRLQGPPLAAPEEDQLLHAARLAWARNPPFDMAGLVAAGVDRIPLIKELVADPDEDLESYFCSELVGALLAAAGRIAEAVNVSTLSPGDLAGMADVFETGGDKVQLLWDSRRGGGSGGGGGGGGGGKGGGGGGGGGGDEEGEEQQGGGGKEDDDDGGGGGGAAGKDA